MKRYLKHITVLAGMTLVMAGCSENSWNDKLDGFEVPDKNGSPETYEFTMTPTEYTYFTKVSSIVNLAKQEGVSAALSQVAANNCLSQAINPQTYMPLFMANPSFPYFSAVDGSAVKMTYNVANALPEGVALGAASGSYVVTEEEYKAVWESEDDYVNAFAPSHPASKSVPAILKAAFPDAHDGQLVVATYQVAAQEPVFQTPDEPVVPGFEMSDVLGTAAKGDQVTVNGYVTGACAAGFMLADKGGTIFVYMGSGYDASTYKIGDQMTITGEVGSYNKGLQIAGGSAEMEVTGHGEYTYPAPVKFDAAYADNAITRADDALAVYATISGKVSNNGKNINIKIDGAATAQGSVYYATDAQKENLADGADVTLTGYFIAIAGKRYCNFVAVDIKANTASRSAVMSRALDIESTQENVMYVYSGNRWSVASGYTVLGHADYQAMGQRYDNLSNDGPATLLPKYLALTFPYAATGDEKMVVYNYYASSTTTRRCDLYTYDGTAWSLNDGVETVTEQYVKNGGKWVYDPSVVITLPAGRGIEISTLYYQTCVDWIKNNVPDGAKYVTSYGNNEYYCGTSAYQGNVDIRPDKARDQYAAGYEGMSDEQIVELMKKRFSEEVLPAALSILHPDAKPIDGLDVFYTINFSVYTGTTTPYVIKYKVTGPGKFEFVECDW